MAFYSRCIIGYLKLVDYLHKFIFLLPLGNKVINRPKMFNDCLMDEKMVKKKPHISVRLSA